MIGFVLIAARDQCNNAGCPLVIDELTGLKEDQAINSKTKKVEIYDPTLSQRYPLS